MEYVASSPAGSFKAYKSPFIVIDNVSMVLFVAAANILLTANGDVKVSLPRHLDCKFQNDTTTIRSDQNVLADYFSY